MRAVVQIVKNASVIVNNQTVGQIDYGLTVYFGVEQGDTIADVEKFASKLVKMRIFDDENGRINRSVIEEGGSLLVISNFTLLADLSQNRPSFFKAANPEYAKMLYNHLLTCLSQHLPVQHGEFGAHMEIVQTVIGPMNILVL